MEIQVLGCSGGIGKGLRTTCLLVESRVLIDAGTGLGDLPMEALCAIDHVFLTHAHLDHVALLPLLVDTVGALRQTPLQVHASSATLAHITQHIFNWHIWPDFSQIPTPDAPWLRFVPMEVGESAQPLPGLTLTALPARHTVPALGYQIDSGTASVVFTGDTTVHPAFWPLVNAIPNLRALIIETAFCNKERAMAEASCHLCPDMLTGELAQLRRPADIYITHLKPGEIALTMQEIHAVAAAFQPRMLHNGQRLIY
jgi:ribonuclease BN (tRNA processing enzyme)